MGTGCALGMAEARETKEDEAHTQQSARRTIREAMRIALIRVMN